MTNVFPLAQMLISRRVDPVRANAWADKYIHLMRRYQIDTPVRVAGFFANILTETGCMKTFSESLNYSAEGMMRTWPKRFQNEQQRALAKAWGYVKDSNGKIIKPADQVAIANYVYGDRLGNRGQQSGDGWRYRGMGPIQVTGLANYIAVQQGTGVPCVDNPEILMQPEGGSISSAYFWWKNKIYVYADRGDIDGVRDLVNIGRKTVSYGDAHGFGFYLEHHKAITSFIQSVGNTIVLP